MPNPENHPRTASLSAADVEAIERNTLTAVSAKPVEAFPVGSAFADWLLPLDPRPIGRASSAFALRHVAPPVPGQLIAEVEKIYESHGLPTAFRLADLPCFSELQAALKQHGYQRQQQTLVQIRVGTGSIQYPGAFSSGERAQIEAAPGADSIRASIRSQENAGDILASGIAAFAHGWCCIHALQTSTRHRGKGLATAVMAALALATMDRGIEKVFLQVEESNTVARSLYAKAGFTTAWRYEYWRKPGTPA